MNLKPIFQFFIAAGILLLIIGNLFKIMHWPYASVMILPAYAIIASIYPRIILMQKKKTKLDLLKVLGIFIWCGCGMAYFIYFPLYRISLAAFSRIGLIGWAGINLYTYIFRENEDEKWQDQLLKFGYIAGVTSLVMGFFFKTMHWPFAGVLIVIGGAIAGMAFFYSEFILDEE